MLEKFTDFLTSRIPPHLDVQSSSHKEFLSNLRTSYLRKKRTPEKPNQQITLTAIAALVELNFLLK